MHPAEPGKGRSNPSDTGVGDPEKGRQSSRGGRRAQAKMSKPGPT